MAAEVILKQQLGECKYLLQGFLQSESGGWAGISTDLSQTLCEGKRGSAIECFCCALRFYVEIRNIGYWDKIFPYLSPYPSSLLKHLGTDSVVNNLFCSSVLT